MIGARRPKSLAPDGLGLDRKRRSLAITRRKVQPEEFANPIARRIERPAAIRICMQGREACDRKAPRLAIGPPKPRDRDSQARAPNSAA